MADVFAAADITGLATSVTAVVVGLLAVSLIFLGRQYLAKAGIRK